MDLPPANELRNHKNSDNPVSAMFIDLQKAANCTITLKQVGYDKEALENSQYLRAKEVIQNEVNEISANLSQSENLDWQCLTSESSMQSVRESGIGNSISSAGTLNSKLSTLSNFGSYSVKSADPFQPYNEDPGPSTVNFKRRKVELFGTDEGPRIYQIKGNLVTPPIIAKNLPECFNSLPIHGKPEPDQDIEKFYTDKIREFVGFDLNDEQFENVAKFCGPEHLKTGKELIMTTSVPTLTVLSVFDHKEYDDDESNLCIVKKHRLRMANDLTNNFQKRLKYRGIRLMPLGQSEEESTGERERDLEPGKDIIYHVRIYRPFPYNIKEKLVSSRHSVFSRDVILCGRLRLSALRDRIVCANDVSMRVDASDCPDVVPPTSAKELFPSGFLFINNVFYVDTRAGCLDRTESLRAWAKLRGLGEFATRDLHNTRVDELDIRLGHPEFGLALPSGFLFINNVFYVDTRAGCLDRTESLRAWAKLRGLGEFATRDLHNTRVDELDIRLGHPEVYVHQGNCEHLFTFSEIRLLNPDDPLSLSQYPTHTAVSQNQSVYCTTCAEFGAKWIVVGCSTVPFDPAYFCETCFKMYLYKDGKKIGDFKAYAYRGNEINMLKTG